MNTADLAHLLLLSAIWGASFLFMRIGAPVLGPSLFLGEHVGWHTVAGSLTVLTGTALVTGFSISTVLPRGGQHAA